MGRYSASTPATTVPSTPVKHNIKHSIAVYYLYRPVIDCIILIHSSTETTPFAYGDPGLEWLWGVLGVSGAGVIGCIWKVVTKNVHVEAEASASVKMTVKGNKGSDNVQDAQDDLS